MPQSYHPHGHLPQITMLTAIIKSMVIGIEKKEKKKKVNQAPMGA
jgi:hypothetical protein